MACRSAGDWPQVPQKAMRRTPVPVARNNGGEETFLVRQTTK